MPQAPQQANWTTLHDDPVIQTSFGENGTATKSTVYPQECEIWQAEEVWVGGKWRPYYGVVAPHQLAMVPGEEIEFIDPGGYDPVGGGWGLRVDVGEQSEDWQKRSNFTGMVGAAVPISVWIRNLKGAEVGFGHGAKLGTPRDVGLEVSLTYTDRPRSMVISWPPPADLQWQPVPMKAPLRVGLQPVPATLASLQSVVLFRFDARDYFDLSRPGTYRLMVKFGKGNALDAGEFGTPQDFEVMR